MYYALTLINEKVLKHYAQQIADFLSLKVTEKYTDNSLFIGSLNISVKISDFRSFF